MAAADAGTQAQKPFLTPSYGSGIRSLRLFIWAEGVESGYVQRSVAKMPKQGSKRPWRLYQNYALDIVSLRFGKVDDGVMKNS
jgi:hypothetical protein